MGTQFKILLALKTSPKRKLQTQCRHEAIKACRYAVYDCSLNSRLAMRQHATNDRLVASWSISYRHFARRLPSLLVFVYL